MLFVTAFLAVNRKSMYEPLSAGNIYLIKTVENYDPVFTKEFKKHKNGIANFILSKFNLKISNSQLDPKFWNELVKEIMSVYDKYDAFVIYCDKDTLVYTASVLSFLLENLAKPIVLSDNNLVSTLKSASHTSIPEVMVQSQSKLFRGCRVIRDTIGSYISPNFPELTTLTCLQRPKESINAKFINPNINIIIFKVFPGFNSSYLNTLVENPNINAIILETEGGGKLPNEPDFLNLINTLATKGVIVLVISQSNKYSNKGNLQLVEAGAILGGDMTTPAAYAKLAFLLGNVNDKKIIGQLLEQNFRGELTINYPPLK